MTVRSGTVLPGPTIRGLLLGIAVCVLVGLALGMIPASDKTFEGQLLHNVGEAVMTLAAMLLGGGVLFRWLAQKDRLPPWYGSLRRFRIMAAGCLAAGVAASDYLILTITVLPIVKHPGWGNDPGIQVLLNVALAVIAIGPPMAAGLYLFLDWSMRLKAAVAPDIHLASEGEISRCLDLTKEAPRRFPPERTALLVRDLDRAQVLVASRRERIIGFTVVRTGTIGMTEVLWTVLRRGELSVGLEYEFLQRAQAEAVERHDRILRVRTPKSDWSAPIEGARFPPPSVYRLKGFRPTSDPTTVPSGDSLVGMLLLEKRLNGRRLL